ncbi:hypothetical protein O3G_MSEX012316 [Manduca sexta]|uniref:TMEM131 second Ig-like domain-containing protein n=1 Tax=Manduca sexta TaxID=7130 RepID=A0A921ZPD5_MANSE|nr:hypothetical protein O3G_MSEX012316 [Manduca sexta]KAG6460932.1 hypothetical protein O3G_MSEX012316 [Manduca sexta]
MTQLSLIIKGSLLFLRFVMSITLAPQANTTFSVVYLGRREGPVSAHLYIHTSLGVYKYPVSAIGVASEWRVWPLVDVRVPLNASVEPLLSMHNPTAHTVQVSEVYSSGAWLGLALPDGGEWAPRDRWTLPPHSSRAIVRLRLQPNHHHHHHHPLTAYVRIKANMTGGGLVVGVEARAAAAGEYLAPLQLALRVRGSQDPPDTFPLELGSSLPAPLRVDAAVWGARCGAGARWAPPPPPAHNGVKSDGVYLTLLRSQLEPHQRLTKAAELTLDYAQMWSAYLQEQGGSAEEAGAEVGGEAGAEASGEAGAEAGGEAWCAGWARVGRAALRYAVRLLPGTLRADPPALHLVTASEAEEGEDALIEREVRLRNEFPVPVHVTAALCPPEVLEHFHCISSAPLSLAAGAAATVLRLQSRAPRSALAPHELHARLAVHTNLTDCAVPLLLYSGRLHLEWEWPNSSDGELRLGAVGTSSTRRVGVRVRNPGPAPLCVTELSVELPGAQLALAACAHLRPVPADHPCRCVEGGASARAVLTVVAPARAGARRQHARADPARARRPPARAPAAPARRRTVRVDVGAAGAGEHYGAAYARA